MCHVAERIEENQSPQQGRREGYEEAETINRESKGSLSP